jgi:hypothetical protein
VNDEGTAAAVPPENKGDELNRFLNKIQNANLHWRNPAAILLTFRDGRATDMETLFAWFGVPLPSKTAPIRTNLANVRDHLKWTVKKLIDAGLLHADDLADGELTHTKISVTELLPKFQTALDLSLTSLATVDPSRSMTVEPQFGRPDALIENLHVFVLMPFKAEMLPVYEDYIKPVCASMKLSVRRADDFFTADAVVTDIWKAVVSARLIVADCTDRNPNVFYEIGLAHAIGKPTILLTQKSEDVPFDLRHLRYIAYQLTPHGMREFEEAFKETIVNVLFLGIHPYFAK